MDISSDFPNTSLMIRNPQLPNLDQAKTDNEAERAARNFTAVFFSEYVGLMLDEVEMDEDEYSFEVYKGLQAQALGDKLVDSHAGQRLTETVLTEIYKIQEKTESAKS